MKYSIDDGSIVQGRKKPVKLILLCISIIIIISLVLLAFNLGLLDPLFESNESYNEGQSSELNILTSSSNIIDFDNSITEEIFEQGDKIYLYFEYDKVNTVDGNGEIDLFIKIRILVDGVIANEYNFAENELKELYEYTIETNENWSVGDYEIKLTLTDNISTKNIYAQSNFELTEKTIEITELFTASRADGLEDYDPETKFNHNDRIYIYQEHSSYSINDEGDCELYLELVVKTNEITMYSDDFNETDSSNQGHIWWFTVEEAWPTGLYYVTSSITDKVSLAIITKTTAFTVS